MPDALPSGSNGRAPSGDWFNAWRFSLLFLVLLLAAYPEIFLGTHALSYRDAALFGYPLAQYFRESFWQAELPLWNPLNNCGLPFLAQWNTLVCYPLSLIYLLLPLPQSMNLFCVLHLFLAALGMYRLARRWTGNSLAASVAGLMYGMNGLTLHSLMWPNNLAALGWMPWVWLAFENAFKLGGRWLVLASLAAATQCLSGAPEIILLTWLSLGIFWLTALLRREIPLYIFAKRLGLMGLLIAALTAIQMLPFLDLLRHSQRSSSFGGDAWAMPPWGWANFLVPLFRCTPSVIGVYSQDEQQWTSSYYCGIGTLLLAFLAIVKSKDRRVPILFGIAAAGLILSLGKNAFVLEWLRSAFPALGFIRFPIKFIVLTIFSLPLLAGFGLAAWQDSTVSSPPRRIFSAASYLLLTGIAITAAIAYLLPFPSDVWSASWKSAASRAAILVIIIIALHSLVKSLQPKSHQLIGLVILGVFGIDILTHTPKQNPTVPASDYGPISRDITPAPQFGHARAMLTSAVANTMSHMANPNPRKLLLGQRTMLLCNLNLLEKIPKVDGFYSLHLREERDVDEIISRGQASNGLLDFLGVSRITSDESLFRWNVRTNFLPLITAGQKPVFLDSAETLARLGSPDFNPREVVYLPSEAKQFVQSTNRTDARVISAHFSPHRIQFAIEAREPSVAVIAQSFYHPWQARVDGVPAPLCRANHAFQAVPIPAGKHDVEIKYEDRKFFLGGIVSGIAWLFSLAALIIRPKGRFAKM